MIKFHDPREERIVIPVISDIAAGLGRIAEGNIKEYLSLSPSESKGADFGVRVIGDSLKDFGISPGDIALIRSQATIENGEVAAILITSPIETEGVLKQYHSFNKIPNLRHWFLESRNRASEHLVVVPSGVDFDAVKSLYDRASRVGKIRNPIEYYKNAEVQVAGKYVGLVKENLENNGHSFTLNHLQIQIAIPALVSVDDFFDSVTEIVRTIEFVYSVYALVHFGKVEVIKNFIAVLEEISNSTKSSNRLLYAFLAAASIQPLRVVSVHYGSPASFDLLGLGKILEILRDTVKDLKWRGNHEKEDAELSRRIKEAEIEEKTLLNIKLKEEIITYRLDNILKVTASHLSKRDKDAIVNILLPKINVLDEKSVLLSLDRDSTE